MKIRVDDVYSTILDAKNNLAAIAVIRSVCSARPAGYQFMPKYRNKVWDGYVSLMPTMAKFPTGLLSDIMYALRIHNYKFELVENDITLPSQTITPDILYGITLRDYQIEAANELIEAKRGVAKMATNSGKTEVMAAVIKALDVESVILVHRKELMYQTAERLFLRGVDTRIGMVGDGTFDPAKVTVAMVQTLGADISRCAHFINNKVLFVDECHTVSSRQSTEVFYAIPGHYRYGVSGTPLKNDVLSDLKLIAATGPVVYELTNEFLISSGYSAKASITLEVMEDLDKDTWELDYHDAYDKFIINSEARNSKITKFAKSIDGTVLILVNMIKHGEILAKLTGGEFVSGRNSTEYRRMILDTMRNDKGIFIASPIFDEGIDVPGVNAIVLAGGGQSQVKLLQRIGRGLRRKLGINELKILDFVDDTNKHLLSHSNARIDTYVQEGFDTILG